MFKKVIAFFISFCFAFEQVGFAQIAGQLDISSRMTSMYNSMIFEKYRPLHLRYLSYDQLNNDFKLLLDKGSTKETKPEVLQKTTNELLKYFFIGIALPNDAFWVNLRPDSPKEIIDDNLAKTEIGKIMLECDLQLKKDTAKYTSPETLEGKEYWDKLYKRAEELYGSENITIPTLTRPWIVPDEIIVREAKGSAYIYKATLKVMLEQDYLKGNANYSFPDEKSKILNEYSSQIIRETIIPKLTREINSSKRYAPLRQVYYSLILAQWFKQSQKDTNSQVTSKIDTKDLSNLTSQSQWDKNTYFKAYQKSFKDGEYNIRENRSSAYGQTIRTYFSGGTILDMKDVLKAPGAVMSVAKFDPGAIKDSSYLITAAGEEDGKASIEKTDQLGDGGSVQGNDEQRNRKAFAELQKIVNVLGLDVTLDEVATGEIREALKGFNGIRLEGLKQFAEKKANFASNAAVGLAIGTAWIVPLTMIGSFSGLLSVPLTLGALGLGLVMGISALKLMSDGVRMLKAQSALNKFAENSQDGGVATPQVSSLPSTEEALQKAKTRLADLEFDYRNDDNFRRIAIGKMIENVKQEIAQLEGTTVEKKEALQKAKTRLADLEFDYRNDDDFRRIAIGKMIENVKQEIAQLEGKTENKLDGGTISEQIAQAKRQLAEAEAILFDARWSANLELVRKFSPDRWFPGAKKPSRESQRNPRSAVEIAKAKNDKAVLEKKLIELEKARIIEEGRGRVLKTARAVVNLGSIFVADADLNKSSAADAKTSLIQEAEKKKMDAVVKEVTREFGSEAQSTIINGVSKAITLELVDILYKNGTKDPDTYVFKTSLADGGLETQEDLTGRINTNNPVRYGFIKDAPILGYKITSAKFSDIPAVIRNKMGAVDQTKYDEAYLSKNIGSMIALQMNGDAADFYIIGKDTFDQKYNVVPSTEVGTKNKKLMDKLVGVEGISDLLKTEGANIIGALKTAPVPMIKMSEIGYDIKVAVTIQSPWGEQTKPAGQDAFLVYDAGPQQYYMVNTEANGNPISYIAKDGGTQWGELEDEKGNIPGFSAKYAEKEAELIKDNPKYTGPFSRSMLDGLTPDDELQVRVNTYNELADEQFGVGFGKRKEIVNGEERWEDPLRDGGTAINLQNINERSKQQLIDQLVRADQGRKPITVVTKNGRRWTGKLTIEQSGYVSGLPYDAGYQTDMSAPGFSELKNDIEKGQLKVWTKIGKETKSVTFHWTDPGAPAAGYAVVDRKDSSLFGLGQPFEYQEVINNNEGDRYYLLSTYRVVDVASIENLPLRDGGLETQEDLTGRINTNNPVRYGFIKDAPILGYKITSAKFSDIPAVIRNKMGAVDQTKYDEAYLSKNIGSMIALQMNGDAADFYIIGKDTFDQKYNVVPSTEVGTKNKKLMDKLVGVEGISDLLKTEGANIIGALKTAPVPMIKMSEIGYDIKVAVTIQSPWGEQTKPAGQDAFLVYDAGPQQYYMVNTEANGNPISYIAKDGGTQWGELEDEKGNIPGFSAKYAEKEAELIKDNPKYTGPFSRSMLDGLTPDDELQVRVNTYNELADEQFGVGFGKRKEIVNGEERWEDPLRDGGTIATVTAVPGDFAQFLRRIVNGEALLATGISTETVDQVADLYAGMSINTVVSEMVEHVTTSYSVSVRGKGVRIGAFRNEVYHIAAGISFKEGSSLREVISQLANAVEVRKDGGDPITRQQTSKEDANTKAPLGGIDFRALPIITQPMGEVLMKEIVNMPKVNIADLDQEWQSLQKMIAADACPSTERIKEFLGACYQKGELKQRADKVLACLAGMLRIEEDEYKATEPQVKVMLALLEYNR